MFPFSLIATDFDGTLSEGLTTAIPSSIRETFSQVRRRGATVAIISGRAPSNLRSIVKRDGLELDGLYISGFNGAKTIQAWDRTILDQHFVDIDATANLLPVLNSIGIEVLMLADGIVYTNAPEGRIAVFEKAVNKAEIKAIPPILSPDHSINKITIGGSLDALSHAIDIVRTDYGHQFEATFSAEGMADITPYGITKGTAVRALQKHTNTSKEETLAFGDQHNDIPLLEAAGHGVAVSNAVPELRTLANSTTTSCANAGVAVYLDNLLDPS